MNNSEVQARDNESNLLIELREDHVADLLINFLGKKEKLAYESENPFSLRLNDIEQFYYLLDEKINKEQYVNVEIFYVTFLFNDKTTRTINTIESLNKYLETRDVFPISVTLSWHIIIKFPNSDTIETQKVDLSFNINSENNIGEVLLNIEHTNQAWGIEVFNLLKNQILSVSRNVNNKIILAYQAKSLFTLKSIAPILLILIVILTMFQALPKYTYMKNINFNVFEYYADGNISREELDDFKFISENIREEYKKKSIDKAIKDEQLKIYLLNAIEEQDQLAERNRKFVARTIITVLLMWVFAYFYLSKFISYNLDRSFIITNNRSQSNYDEYNSIKKKVEFYSISLFVFTIISGLIVNMINSYLWDG